MKNSPIPAFCHSIEKGHCQLAASGQLNLGDRQLIEIYCQHTLQISAQIFEFLGSGSSVLGGRDMIAAEMEEVVDLIVG